jgi:hypothetical protein
MYTSSYSHISTYSIQTKASTISKLSNPCVTESKTSKTSKKVLIIIMWLNWMYGSICQNHILIEWNLPQCSFLVLYWAQDHLIWDCSLHCSRLVEVSDPICTSQYDTFLGINQSINGKGRISINITNLMKCLRKKIIKCQWTNLRKCREKKIIKHQWTNFIKCWRTNFIKCRWINFINHKRKNFIKRRWTNFIKHWRMYFIKRQRPRNVKASTWMLFPSQNSKKSQSIDEPVCHGVKGIKLIERGEG